ncbi:DUF5060 domain-containing protein [Thalassobellus citreus]|uniref:DUF5060 domain-containing protein n=1 Tax=Thalassobellus citreus TaxID=3367752 RepID=UPI00378DC83A
MRITYLIFLTFAFAVFSCAKPEPLEQIGLYRTFEKTLENTNVYANKFNDVQLNTTFISPSGKTTEFFGFFDGDGKGGRDASTGNIWKMRFIPNEIGIWTYKWSWSDATEGGKAKFECISEEAGKGVLQAYKENSIEIKRDTTILIQNDTTKVYTFNPVEWNIKQGVVTDAEALENTKNINLALLDYKQTGKEVFEIGSLDAYFKVDVYSTNRQKNTRVSIKIPSNTHFKMSSDTFLRVQPTAAPAYTLLSATREDNVLITGGNLIGDRYEHDYSPVNDDKGRQRNEHGYGFLIWFIGTHNAVVDGVYTFGSIGENISCHGTTVRNRDGTIKMGERETYNLLIKNCIIDEARRNGISCLDGTKIIIDNCDFINTGKGEQAYDVEGNRIFSSSGTPPCYAIDLEVYRERDDDGTLLETSKLTDIVIKNSHFTGSGKGDIDLYTVSNVLIENNYFESWIANIAANDIIIRNNVFIGNNNTGKTPSKYAILLKSNINDLGEEMNYNYKIYNNLITGYFNAFTLSGDNYDVYNNVISDFQSGLMIGALSNSKIHDNVYNSSYELSYGLKSRATKAGVNTVIYNEKFNVNHRPIDFRRFNSDGLNQLIIKDCVFNTSNTNFKLHVTDSNNILFQNITTNTDFDLKGSINIIVE